MNFTMVPSRYPTIPAFLKKMVPEFAASDEYQLHGDTIDDLPGVVLAAFGRYAMRVAQRSTDVDPQLTRALLVLSDIAGWEEAVVDTQLCDEVFEIFAEHPGSEAKIRSLMTGRLRILFDTWRPTWP